MELNIYFKLAGDGDTIFLDWAGSDIPLRQKYGMIDCNLVDNGINSVIRHIQKNKIKEFEFVILSHPHSDHYSGFPQFFDYCNTNAIVIKKFIHTISFDSQIIEEWKRRKINNKEFVDIITSSVNRIKDKNLLLQLFELLHKQSVFPTYIKSIFVVGNDSEMSLTNDLKLRFLSPNPTLEIRKYINSLFNNNEIQSKTLKVFENNPDANLLSTFLQLYSKNDDWQILLCSDVTKYSLNRIKEDAKLFNELKERKVLAIQIPGQGSLESHLPDFWDDLNITESSTFISVKEKFVDADSEVFNYFKNKCQSIHFTNFTGDLREHYGSRDGHPDFQDLDYLFDISTFGFDLHNEKRASEKYSTTYEKHFQVKVSNGVATSTVFEVEL